MFRVGAVPLWDYLDFPSTYLTIKYKESQARLELIQSGFFMSIYTHLWNKHYFSVGCRSPPYQSEFLPKNSDWSEDYVKKQ